MTFLQRVLRSLKFRSTVLGQRVLRSLKFRSTRLLVKARWWSTSKDPMLVQAGKFHNRHAKRDNPLFIHEFRPGVKLPESGFGETDSGSRKLEWITRIRDAIRHEKANEGVQADDVWAHFIRRHEEILALLETDAAGAQEYLDNMFSKPLTLGFQQGDLVYESLLKHRSMRSHVTKNHIDKMAALAESLGCVLMENPESGPWAELVHRHPDEVLEQIAGKLGCELKGPSCQGGLYGIKTRYGHFTSRDFTAMYAAHRISELCPDKDTPICEIGAGAGYVAYYCWLLGYRNFTIIDIPSVNIAQAYFLGQNLPDARVILSGEGDPWGNEPGIRVLSPRYFDEAPDGYFGLTLNVDSMPEIDTAISSGYLQKIKRNSGLFLSMNHEAKRPLTTDKVHSRVFELIDEVGGFKRISRHPFWMRRGYAEELYQVKR